MYKKRGFLITFEGVEGSGKSFHSKKLYNSLKKLKYPVIYTREPGGSNSAEKIRELILAGKKDKFQKFTDFLLILASRNEHIKNKIFPSLKKKKIIICDRFTDSTIAYQGSGYGIKKSLIDKIHNEILGYLKADLTFVMHTNINIAIRRIKMRKSLNRYDKLSKNFYNKVQKSFLHLAKKNKKKYLTINTNKNPRLVQTLILKRVLNIISHN